MEETETYPTPEDAARGAIPDRYARVLGVSLSPDGRHAVVLLGTNKPPQLYPYQVLCEREVDGWVEIISGNAPGWSATSEHDDADNVGVATAWGEAPPSARASTVAFAGSEHDVPVINGYYLFAAWNVPAESTARRFSDHWSVD